MTRNYIDVKNQQELESNISVYIGRGFTVANRTTDNVTLIKPKKFSILMAVIGFFLFFFPLFIYIIIYMFQSDEVVEIRLSASAKKELLASERKCPFCAETIKAEATVCKHCGKDLSAIEDKIYSLTFKDESTTKCPLCDSQFKLDATELQEKKFRCTSCNKDIKFQ